MRTLKVNEAVHCKTQKEFNSAKEILSESFGSIHEDCYKHAKENTCLGNYSAYGYGYEDKQWFIDHGCKILSYSEFMGISKFHPVDGEMVWILNAYDKGFFIYQGKYNKRINIWVFKTRKLVRIAKANLLKCINEQEHE